jgi:hypothetical protein
VDVQELPAKTLDQLQYTVIRENKLTSNDIFTGPPLSTRIVTLGIDLEPLQILTALAQVQIQVGTVAIARCHIRPYGSQVIRKPLVPLPGHNW